MAILEKVSTQDRIKQWLESNVDEGSKETIRKWQLDGNSEALEEAFYKELAFGTGGLRGIMGVGANRMNQYTVGKATQGFANYLNKKYRQAAKVVVAYDSRHQSAFFASVTARVFAANGIDVFLFEELRPTPLLSFAIRYLGCQAGVMVTASHNPKIYNGYKAYGTDGAQLVNPDDEAVMEAVQEVDLNDILIQDEQDKTRIHEVPKEVTKAYWEILKKQVAYFSSVDVGKDVGIVYSALHGTGITLVPQFLEAFGFSSVHVVEDQAIPDGDFPTVVYPNPEEAEALKMALSLGDSISADLVMATDPDADRVGIAIRTPNDGLKLLNGNQTFALLAYALLKQYKAVGKLDEQHYLIKTIVTSNLIEKIADSFGVKCYNTLTGFKHIAAKMNSIDDGVGFLVGGEESYGYLVGNSVRDKDGVSSCVLLAHIAALQKSNHGSLYDLLVEIYTRYGFYKEHLLSITKEGKAGVEAISNMMKGLRETPLDTLGGEKVVKVIDYAQQKAMDLQSGVTKGVDIPASNVLQLITESGSVFSARPSGTEPKIKFYFSVHSPLKGMSLDEVEQHLDEKIDSMVKDLRLK